VTLRRNTVLIKFLTYTKFIGGLRPLIVAEWLRYYTTNRKVAGSIPDGVIVIFH
jgi:hypothetical protein